MAARPIRLVDPHIILGGSEGPPVVPGVDLTCFARGIHLTGEADDDLATFCDPEGFAYTLTIDFLMSLGPESLDEALQEIGGPGTVVPFEFAYTKDDASPANPHWSGRVRIPAIPIVDAGINEPTNFSLEMATIGEIMRDNGTGPAPMIAHTHHPVSPAATTVAAPANAPETVAA